MANENDSDFRFEYNNQGDWCLAFLMESHDENNKQFVYWAGDGWDVTTGFVPRGTDAGHFRDKS